MALGSKSNSRISHFCRKSWNPICAAEFTQGREGFRWLRFSHTLAACQVHEYMKVSEDLGLESIGASLSCRELMQCTRTVIQSWGGPSV